MIAHLLSSLASPRTKHLLETFLVFVGFEAFFARLYFSLYKRDRASFSFNSEVKERQSDLKRATFESEVKTLTKAGSAIEELAEALHDGSSPLQPRGWEMVYEIILRSGVRCATAYAPARRMGQSSRSSFQIHDPDGTNLFSNVRWGYDRASFAMYFGRSRLELATREQWRSELPYWKNKIDQRAATATSRFASLSTDTPDIWTYWDFFYFSTIVQTTVGFGDILPNSTIVRMLVSLQITIGYLLLVVVLNIVLGG
jgi:hypothetical protein